MIDEDRRVLLKYFVESGKSLEAIAKEARVGVVERLNTFHRTGVNMLSRTASERLEYLFYTWLVEEKVKQLTLKIIRD